MPSTGPRGAITSSAGPLSHQVANRLWDEVVADRARAGDRLPSERTLADRYGVSRVTVRAALGELEGRGLVQVSAARGWSVVVGAAPVVGDATGHTVQGFADYAAERGLSSRSAVLESGVRPASVAEAERLRVAPGVELFTMRRLRYLDELVVALEVNRLPLRLCPALASTDFEQASLYATLRAGNPPQLPRVADYSVEARHPDADERALLEITGAVPLLVADQLTYNQDGRPLEWTTQAFRGDRYRFRASITD